MAHRSARILLAFLSILLMLSLHVSAATRGSMVGGWKPIDNPKDPEVVKIAKFAVEQHNKKANKMLQFVSLLKGESQVVAGMNYRLTISAKDGAAAKTYLAVVYSRAWENYLELTSFEQTKG